jgi:hypothetical protein
VCHENGQTCKDDSFWVIADRTFIELVCTDIDKTCCSDVVSYIADFLSCGICVDDALFNDYFELVFDK